jgi:protein-tyrosine-phosphatase
MKEPSKLLQKSILAFVCIFLSDQMTLAQNEKVVFNLDKGEFNTARIPYVHPITVTGIANKNGVQLDAIALTVTKNIEKESTELKAKRFEKIQLEKEADVLATSRKSLDDVLKIVQNDADQATIKKFLEEHNFTDLSKSIDDITEPDQTKKKKAIEDVINGKIEKVQKEQDNQEKSKIKLSATIFEMETTLGGPPFYEGLWQRTPAENEFNFSMPTRLEMSESYNFVFTLYTQNKSAFPVDKFLDTLISDINVHLKTDAFFTQAAAAKRVDEVLSNIENIVFTNVFSLTPGTSNFARRGLNITKATKDKITKLVFDYQLNLRTIAAEKSNIEGNSKVAQDLIKAKKNITIATQNKLLGIAEKEGQHSNLDAALKAANFKSDSIITILNFYDPIQISKATIIANEAQAKKTLAALAAEFDFIRSLFVQAGTVTRQNQTGASGNTDINGIRIGTTYGVGLVPLDANTVEWFRFLGINIRFADFDNRLPGKEAYKRSLWSRCSFMIGISTTSDMEYKGKKLENTRLGVKPVIGFNIEPIKHINFGAGIISFIQEPIGNSQRDPKLRFYTSLSFDFNLFNYLIQNQ